MTEAFLSANETGLLSSQHSVFGIGKFSVRMVFEFVQHGQLLNHILEFTDIARPVYNDTTRPSLQSR
jgi:hypothetical protein